MYLYVYSVKLCKFLPNVSVYSLCVCFYQIRVHLHVPVYFVLYIIFLLNLSWAFEYLHNGNTWSWSLFNSCVFYICIQSEADLDQLENFRRKQAKNKVFGYFITTLHYIIKFTFALYMYIYFISAVLQDALVFVSYQSYSTNTVCIPVLYEYIAICCKCNHFINFLYQISYTYMSIVPSGISGRSVESSHPTATRRRSWRVAVARRVAHTHRIYSQWVFHFTYYYNCKCAVHIVYL